MNLLQKIITYLLTPKIRKHPMTASEIMIRNALNPTNPFVLSPTQKIMLEFYQKKEHMCPICGNKQTLKEMHFNYDFWFKLRPEGRGAWLCLPCYKRNYAEEDYLGDM